MVSSKIYLIIPLFLTHQGGLRGDEGAGPTEGSPLLKEKQPLFPLQYWQIPFYHNNVMIYSHNIRCNYILPLEHQV